METQMTELKPCPYCKKLPNRMGRWFLRDIVDHKAFRIACVDLSRGHSIETFGYGKTMEEAENDAIEKWNRRSYE